MKNKIACATVVKNAGYRFAEWIAYNLAIGIDSIVILDNGSTDNTVDIAAAFSKTYDVRIEPWENTSQQYQLMGYDYMLASMAGTVDWCACIDCDEFIVLPVGKTMQDLVELPSDISAIAMSWAFFGSNGYESAPEDLVIKSFVHRAPAEFGPNKQIKSIIRPNDFTTCENVHFFKLRGGYVDMAHRPIEVKYHDLPYTPDYLGGKLHHYFVQSKEDWQAKISRGYHDTTRSIDQFKGYDRNDMLDESALQYLDRVEEILLDVFGNDRPRKEAKP